MKVVYIAGKYRGANAWEVERNIRAAEEVAARVWAAGMVALCPHANARHMLEGVTTVEHALAGTMELMRRCDAVLLVSPFCQSSAGTTAEVEEAAGSDYRCSATPSRTTRPTSQRPFAGSRGGPPTKRRRRPPASATDTPTAMPPTAAPARHPRDGGPPPAGASPRSR